MGAREPFSGNESRECVSRGQGLGAFWPLLVRVSWCTWVRLAGPLCPPCAWQPQDSMDHFGDATVLGALPQGVLPGTLCGGYSQGAASAAFVASVVAVAPGDTPVPYVLPGPVEALGKCDNPDLVETLKQCTSTVPEATAEGLRALREFMLKARKADTQKNVVAAGGLEVVHAALWHPELKVVEAAARVLCTM